MFIYKIQVQRIIINILNVYQTKKPDLSQDLVEINKINYAWNKNVLQIHRAASFFIYISFMSTVSKYCNREISRNTDNAFESMIQALLCCFCST